MGHRRPGGPDLEGSINRILGDDRPRAEEEFLRLSLLLNASDIIPDARDRLARRLYFAQMSDLQSDVGVWLTDGFLLPAFCTIERRASSGAIMR